MREPKDLTKAEQDLIAAIRDDKGAVGTVEGQPIRGSVLVFLATDKSVPRIVSISNYSIDGVIDLSYQDIVSSIIANNCRF
jgi:hypothetical protein